VSKLAREEVTVALSGDGGDELFFGYDRFWSVVKNVPYRRLPKVLRPLYYRLDQLTSRRRTRRTNECLMHDSLVASHQSMHSRLHDPMLAELYPDLRDVPLPEAFDVYDYTESDDVVEMLRSMRRAEFYGMMQKTLHKVDRASMANSLEVRVPFLKKTFIEAAVRVDPMISARGGMKKQLLKDLVATLLPGAPVNAAKRGFTVPLGRWIREDLRTVFEEFLETPAERILLQRHLGGADYKWPLFTLYSLNRWRATRG
jgi:asparagine synthase (glutamine-hydrolysing)